MLIIYIYNPHPHFRLCVFGSRKPRQSEESGCRRAHPADFRDAEDGTEINCKHVPGGFKHFLFSILGIIWE